MRTGVPHHRIGVLTAVVGIAVVLPLSAAGGDIGPAAGTDPQVAITIPVADPPAIWAVLRKLPADDVETLHRSLTPEVRDDLADVVRAAADAASYDG